MSETSVKRTALCPACSRRFRWEPRVAGKKILCPCTVKFRMPTKAPVGEAVGLPLTETAETSSSKAGKPSSPSPAARAPASPPASPKATSPPPAAAKPAPPPEEEEELPFLSEEEPAAESLPELTEDEPIVDLVPTRKEVVAPARETYDVDEPEPAPAPRPPVRPAAVAAAEANGAGAEAEGDAESDVPAPMPSMLAGPKSVIERALENREEEYKPPFIWEYGLPGAMIAMGLVLKMALWAFCFGPTLGKGLAAGGILVGIEALVFVPIALGAAVATARAMDVGFGEFWPLVVKLAGISFLCGTLGDSVGFWVFHYGEFDWTYAVTAFAPYPFLLGGPLMLMFRLEFKEAFLPVGIIGIPRLVTVVGLVALAPSLFKMPGG